MNRAVIAVADQVIVQELRSRLDQGEVEVEVVFVAESTPEMVSAVLSHRPSLLFVHDRLGPGPMTHAVRDLTLRHPALGVLLVTGEAETDAYSKALDAGARGVLIQPFGLEDINHRVASLVEWSQRMRAAMADHGEDGGGDHDRGARVIAVAGAKGGVGATVMAAHLAWDVARSEREMRVCLVDLDVEKGDVPSYLDVSHRVSIADLAKISEDLAARAVSDTVVVHSSGLHLLLAPAEIRDSEFVTPEAVRRIIAQLRSLYHLVILDTGAGVTTTQSAAVESADLTLQVATADVPALRAARRQVLAWESLGVVGADRVRVVINRFVRRSEIQQDTMDALILGQRSNVLVPELERGLERAGNSRTPGEVRNGAWWNSLRAIGGELEVTRAFRRAADQSDAAEIGAPAAQPATRTEAKGEAKRGGVRRRRPSRAAGQATLETVALVPLAMLVLIVAFQVVLLGVSVVCSDAATSAAARAVSIGTDPGAAARNAVPDGMRSGTAVTAGSSTVEVRVKAPLLVGTGIHREIALDVDHRVVREPR